MVATIATSSRIANAGAWGSRAALGHNGAAYVVVQDTGASPKLHVYKSTNGTTWTEQDSANAVAVTSATGCYSATLGNVEWLYVLYATGASSLRVRRFNIRTDTWETTDIGGANATAAANIASTCAVAVRSDGDVIAFYRQTGTIQAAYARYEGVGWGSDIAVVTAADVTVNDAILLDGDRLLFLVNDTTNGDNTYRTLDQTNVLSTQTDWDATAHTSFVKSSRAALFQTAGTGTPHSVVFLGRDSTGELDYYAATHGSTLGAAFAGNVSTSLTPQLTSAACAAINDRVYAIWGEANAIVYDVGSSAGNPTFGTDVSLLTGLTDADVCPQAIAALGGLGVVYQDAGTVKIEWIVAPTTASGTPWLLVGADGVGASSTTTVSVTKPGALAVGDAIVCLTRTGNSSPATSDSSLFAQVDSAAASISTVQTWVRIADGTEPSTFGFTTAGAATFFQAVLMVLRPPSGLAAADVHAMASNASATAICAPGVTPSAVGAIVWFGWTNNTGAATPPAGYTVPFGGTAMAGTRAVLAYKAAQAASATGDQSGAGTAANNIGALVALIVSSTVSQSGSDSDTITVAEGQTISTTVDPAGDSDTISLVETPTISSSLTPSSGTLPFLVMTEVATISSTLTSPDTSTIAETETASIAADLSLTDTSTITISEVASSTSAFTRTDSGTIAVVESATAAVPFTQGDLDTITSVEITSLSAQVTPSDTTTLTVVETASIQTSLTVTDLDTVTVVESASAGTTYLQGDAGTIAVVEGTSTSIGFTKADLGDIDVGEDQSFTATMAAPGTGFIAGIDWTTPPFFRIDAAIAPANDSTTIGVTVSTDVQAVVFEDKTSSDSGTVTVVEGTTVLDVPLTLIASGDSATIGLATTEALTVLLSATPAMLEFPFSGSLVGQDRAGVVTPVSSGPLRYGPAKGARANLVANPSFEDPATLGLWAGTGGGTIALVTDDGTQGTSCLEISGSVAGAGANTISSGFVVIPGHTYTFSLDAKLMSGASDWNLSIVAENANNQAIVVTTNVVKTIASSWARYTATYTVPTSPPNAHRLGMWFRRASTAAGTARIDAVLCEEASVVQPYFDGSFPGAAWIDLESGLVAIPHGSASVSCAAVMVEEGATNAIPNPRFTGGTNWSAIGATWTADGTYQRLNQFAQKFVTNNVSAGEGIVLNTSQVLVAQGQRWTGSIFLRGLGTGLVKILLTERDTSGTILAQWGYTGGVTPEILWQRFVVTTNIDEASTTNLTLDVITASQQATTFWVICPQLEQNDHVTSYLDGGIGGGYNWTGTEFNSPSVRASTMIRFGQENTRIKTERGALVAWVNRQTEKPNFGDHYLMSLGQVVTGRDSFRVLVSTFAGTKLHVEWRSNGAIVPTAVTDPSLGVPLAIWTFVYVDWDGPVQRAAIDAGAPIAGDARIPPVGNLDVISDASIGASNPNPTTVYDHLDGLIGPFLILDRPLTDAERLALYADPPPWEFGAPIGDSGFLGSSSFIDLFVTATPPPDPGLITATHLAPFVFAVTDTTDTGLVSVTETTTIEASLETSESSQFISITSTSIELNFDALSSSDTGPIEVTTGFTIDEGFIHIPSADTGLITVLTDQSFTEIKQIVGTNPLLLVLVTNQTIDIFVLPIPIASGDLGYLAVTTTTEVITGLAEFKTSGDSDVLSVTVTTSILTTTPIPTAVLWTPLTGPVTIWATPGKLTVTWTPIGARTVFWTKLRTPEGILEPLVPHLEGWIKQGGGPWRS